MPFTRNRAIAMVTFCLSAIPHMLPAEEYVATPATLRSLLGGLQPGDRLVLSEGTYEHFTISDLNGTPDAWITITGVDAGSVVVEADLGPCCNTIEIRNSSYIAIENLTVDGRGVAGAFGVSAKGGSSNRVHHVRIEGCTFVNHDATQQTVAISTKTPTWGWIIRRNTIVGAGTGLYLGNSDGSDPFVGGLIEYNLIKDTIGYNMQIKWQQPWPADVGLPQQPLSTIIRHNVFIKTDRPSPDGNRPNVLVGGFPDSGPGSENMYEIYGNLFYHNPRESLIQCSGRVAIHDNLFVDVNGRAINLRNHDLPLRLAHVYNNTIYGASTGIAVSGLLDQGAIVAGNLIFADTPISAAPAEVRDNITDSVSAAANYVNKPSTTLGEFDLYPLPNGSCSGQPMDLSAFSAQVDFDRDFNGTPKGDRTFRGAYTGEGNNPGWRPEASIQPDKGSGPGPSDGGTSDDGGITQDEYDQDDGAEARDEEETAQQEDGGTGTDAQDHSEHQDSNQLAESGHDEPGGKIKGSCGCANLPTQDGDWLLLAFIVAFFIRRRLHVNRT